MGRARWLEKLEIIRELRDFLFVHVFTPNRLQKWCLRSVPHLSLKPLKLWKIKIFLLFSSWQLFVMRNSCSNRFVNCSTISIWAFQFKLTATSRSSRSRSSKFQWLITSGYPELNSTIESINFRCLSYLCRLRRSHSKHQVNLMVSKLIDSII